MTRPGQPPDRWISGLRVGLMAHVLGDAPLDANRAYRNALRDALAEGLRERGALGDGKHRQTALRWLPTSSLRMLIALEGRLGSRHGLEAELPSWREALVFTTTIRKAARPSLLNASRLFAHLLLEGHCSPSFLAQCGRVLVGDNWRWLEREEAWKTAALPALNILRAPFASENRVVCTQDRLEALSAFRQAFKGNMQHWEIIANAVYQQLYAWPLTISEGDAAVATGFSVPIAVDVAFDGQGEGDVTVLGTDGGDIIVEGWRAEFKRAAQAGKDLWRSKNGRLSPAFRDKIRNASITFDMGVAREMVKGAPFSLELSDKSLGAYMAQVVLHRLLGRSVGFTSAVTGEIGQRRSWPDGSKRLDYEVKAVNGVAAKLRYVFRSQAFSKVVLPQNGPDEEQRTTDYLGAAEEGALVDVNYCYHLSNVADAVQSSGWREHAYIRAPDVARLIHKRSHLLPGAATPEVRRVEELLVNSNEAVVHLPDDVAPNALAAYLRHVNFEVREALSPWTPPSLSWIFVRAVPDETDWRLWQTIWQAMGASREDFTRFGHASTVAEAAHLTREALNTLSPRESCPSHRAPDLLVVLGARNLGSPEWKADGLYYRSHLFPAVMEALGREDLLPIPQEKLRPYLGKTRVIVLPHGESDVSVDFPAPSAPLARADRGVLERLSVFRFGFTQQMASVVLQELGMSGVAVRKLLQRLVEKGYACQSASEYWVKGNIGAPDICLTRRPIIAAKWHWAAAQALAPYLSTADSRGVDNGTALLPHNIHEATYHLETAGNFVMRAPPSSAEELHHSIRVAHGRMLRFIESPSHDSVRALCKNRYGLSTRAAWEMALELLEEKKRLGVEASPLEIATYCDAGCRLLEEMVRNQSQSPEFEDLKNTVIGFFRDALAATAALSLEAKSSRLVILTKYALFLQLFNTNLPFMSIDVAKAEILDLIQCGVKSTLVEARWFEREGDACEDPHKAAEYYKFCVTMSPGYHRCQIKLAGAMHSSGDDELDVGRHLRELSPKSRHDLTLWANRQKVRVLSTLDQTWAVDRWHAGINVARSMAAEQ